MADSPNPFLFDPQRIETETRGGWYGDAGDWMYRFGASALSAMPELLGISPSEETERWRMNNPIAGVISELGGTAVPYLGWLKAARSIKTLETIAKGFEAGAATKPFTAFAGAEAVRFLPFEVGRVAASQVVGDKSFGEMATEAALNLTVGSVLAGGIGTLAGAGKVARGLGEVADDVDASLPPQLLLRKLDDLLPQRPDLAGELTDHTARLTERALGETADRYVAKEIAGDKDGLNRLFKVSGDYGQTVQKRRPVSGESPDTFATPEAWQQALSDAGVEPTVAARQTQFPRIINFDETKDFEAAARLSEKQRAFTEKMGDLDLPEGLAARPGPATRAAERVENTIVKQLDPVGDGWYVKREPDDGMYVMARKYRGDVGKPSAKDAWVMFKTDRPQTFVQKSQVFLNAQVAREKWITGRNSVEEALAGADNTVFGRLHNVQSLVPFEKYREASFLGGNKGVAGIVERTAPKALANNRASQHMTELVREYFAPAIRQLKRSTRGNWLLHQGRVIQDGYDTFTQEVLQGRLKLDPGRNALRQLVMATEEPGSRSVQAVLNDLEKEGLIPEFVDLVRKGIGSKRAAQLAAEGKLRPRTAELAKEMEGFDATVMREVNLAERAAGRTPTKWREGHYGLPRTWDGDFFQAIRDEAGKVVGMAAGHNQRGAQQAGAKLVERLGKELGRPVHAAQVFQRGQTSKIPQDLIPFVTRPGFTLERQNIRGFKWDLETPTKQDLLEAYGGALRQKARYMGSAAREALLGRQVAALGTEDPFALKVVSQRFNALSGVEGEFSKWQNRMADKVLGPYIGSRSASKIVEVTNKGLMHLQLGALKLSYPITNVIGVLQVVAPEVAFISRALPETVAGNYHMTVPMVGSRGTVGAMGVLSPLKIMSGALKETMKPAAGTTALLERAVNERVIDARLIEDYVGQNAARLTNFKGAVNSPKDFVRWLGAVSEFMPSTSERFARVFSFNAGVVAARDIMKLTDEDQVYRFAKQFVERTNYLYSSADRPLVFTSPLGSSMGLFKNWMMNYMATMLEYTNLGLTQNLWSPLAWQTMGTFAVGGAAATPLYWAAEGASRIFADKSLMQWSYDEFSQGRADGLMYGLPAALTGVSLSSQMTSPGANPMRDAAQLFSFASWDRAKNLGQGVGAAIDHWRATGEHPGADPDVRNHLIKAFAPVNLYRVMATQEEGFVNNLGTDLPTAKGLSWMDVNLYRMGLQPLALEKQMAVAQELYSKRESMRAAVSRLGDTFFEAMEANDSRMMDRVLQQALVAGVDISAVMQSATMRGKNSLKTTAERLGKPADLVRYQNVLGTE